MPSPILYINEFASGVYTQRNPLVTPTSAQGLSTVVRTDVLIDGQNMELSNNSTLLRRPGLTRYCSAQLGAADVPLNFHTFRNTSGVIRLLVDTPNTVYSFTNSALTPLYTKGSTQITRFVTVGNFVFMCNGTDAKKWDGTNLTTWGIVAPPTAITIGTSAGSLSPTSGYSYVYTYLNSSTNTESTASPLSGNTGPGTLQEFTLRGTLSSDPQVDKINIYRTLDGGSSYYYLTTVLNNTGFSVTGYTDNNPDSTLNNQITAPVNHADDPPPTGINNSVFHMNRLWASVRNLVYFAGGPDTIVGVPEEAWPTANTFAFPGAITAMVSTSQGLLVFTNQDCFIVLGNTSGNFYSQVWQDNFGTASQDCVESDGDLVFIYTSMRQLFAISTTLDEIGFPIGDKLLAGFVPANVYLAIHRAGSDSGLFISDGNSTIYRYNITKQAWSPVAIYSSIRAVKSIFVADGDYRLFLGRAAVNNYLLFRDLTQFQDDGAPFTCYGTIGTLVLAGLGSATAVEAVSIDRIAVGSDATVSMLVNEISGNFIPLSNPQPEPPILPLSQTISSKRYYLKSGSSPVIQMARHLQAKIAFPSENARNEVLGFALLPPSS